MKHTVFKFFSIGAYEKEETWLNNMAAKGMLLTNVGLCRYVFEDGNRGEYVYRLELLDHLPSHPESASYLKFLEDIQVEFVGSYLRWVYLRKKTEEGVFELYSDIESKIKHAKRITAIANSIFALFLCLSVLWIREAWNQYVVYQDWIGFYGTPPYRSYLFLSVGYISMAVFCQLIVLPVRKTLRNLKKEQNIRE